MKTILVLFRGDLRSMDALRVLTNKEIREMPLEKYEARVKSAEAQQKTIRTRKEHALISIRDELAKKGFTEGEGSSDKPFKIVEYTTGSKVESHLRHKMSAPEDTIVVCGEKFDDVISMDRLFTELAKQKISPRATFFCSPQAFTNAASLPAGITPISHKDVSRLGEKVAFQFKDSGRPGTVREQKVEVGAPAPGKAG